MDIWGTLFTHSTSMVAQKVKNLPEMQEIQVQTLGQEDPLEKAMATHFIILSWKVPWTEEPGWLQSMGGNESNMTEQLTVSHFSYTHNTHHFAHDIQLSYLTMCCTQYVSKYGKLSSGHGTG